MNERELLLELRRKIAKSHGQSTYLVYNDAEMEMLLRERPKTIEELTKLKGFPASGKRVQAYGAVLIKVFNRQPQNNSHNVEKVVSDNISGSSIFNKR